MMTCLILNTPGAYKILRSPLIVLVTLFRFVRWPPGHWRMLSFGIAKGRKGARDIIWIMILAPWMMHTRAPACGIPIYRSTDVDRVTKVDWVPLTEPP